MGTDVISQKITFATINRHLRPAAHKYLSAPPTPVASEQLFSMAGQPYADQRSNLNGNNEELYSGIQHSSVWL